MAGGTKVHSLFYELMKRFKWGKEFKPLHPVEDMEIEFDEETEEVDIK